MPNLFFWIYFRSEKKWWYFEIRLSYIHISQCNLESHGVIPCYIAIGVIGIYFDFTPGIHWKYLNMTPVGPRLLMYSGGYPYFLQNNFNAKIGLNTYGSYVRVTANIHTIRFINPFGVWASTPGENTFSITVELQYPMAVSVTLHGGVGLQNR